MSNLEFISVVKQDFSVFLTTSRSCEQHAKKIERTHRPDATHEIVVVVVVDTKESGEFDQKTILSVFVNLN
jgi:hypothetical protein